MFSRELESSFVLLVLKKAAIHFRINAEFTKFARYTVDNNKKT